MHWKNWWNVSMRIVIQSLEDRCVWKWKVSTGKMKVEELFKEIFRLSQDKANPIWKQEIDHCNLHELDSLIGAELETQGKVSRENFMQTAMYYLEGIIRSKQNVNATRKTLLNFLQFSHCTDVARMCNSNGLFSNSHDWLEFSLSDDITAGQRYTEPDRIIDFQQSADKLIVLNRTNTLLYFMGELFYYSWKKGGLKELAEIVFNAYWKLAVHNSKEFPFYDEPAKLKALCHALAWAINNKKEERKNLALALVKIYETSDNPESRKLAVVQLSGGGAEFTSKTKSEWARIGLDEYGDVLRAHERLQLLNNYCVDDIKKIEEKLVDIRVAIKDYIEFIEGKEGMLKYEKARIFSVWVGLLLKCLENSKIDIAITLISDFKQIDEASRISLNQLFAIVNYSPSVAYSSIKFFIKGDNTTIEGYCAMVSQCNLFLGTTVTIVDVPEFVLVQPRIMGAPDINEGVTFEKILHNHYSLELLSGKNLSELDSIVVLPGVQHPIQAIMTKELGTSLPISVSFEKPLPERRVKKVLLWCFGTRTSDPERELVTKIFMQSGVEVEAVDILSVSKDDFKNKYSSLEYDVVWLATHGQYEHFAPHKSSIEILNAVYLEVEEIFRTEPQGLNQRLLFLNICDGATVASYNALYDIGIGASLCNKNQAVLSHIWPIEVDYALVFALLYGHYLAKGNPFFVAHQNTIKTILRGRDEMKHTLREYDFINKELVDKLSPQVPTNIYYWGSSAYYQ